MFSQLSETIHKYKLKGDEPLSFHLGCAFSHDPDGTHYYQPKNYISKILGTYKHMFPGEPFMKQSSPIDKGDHQELDDSEFISEKIRLNIYPQSVQPNG